MPCMSCWSFSLVGAGSSERGWPSLVSWLLLMRAEATEVGAHRGGIGSFETLSLLQRGSKQEGYKKRKQRQTRHSQSGRRALGAGRGALTMVASAGARTPEIGLERFLLATNTVLCKYAPKIPTAPTHHSNLYSTVLERAHE